MTVPPRALVFRREQWLAMLHYVDRHRPLEACGLLAGKAERVESVIFVRNQAESPVRFVMDPHEQLAAFQRIESEGLDLLAIFHSHPAGPEGVSPTDIAEAAYPVTHIIWSRNHEGWRARGYWIDHGQISEVPLQVIV